MSITITIIMALIALVTLAALCAWLGRKAGSHLRLLNPRNVAWNVAQLGVSEHESGHIGHLADAQIATRYLLVKRGSDANHIAQIAAASDVPYGVCIDAPYAAGSGVTTRLLNASKGTQTMIAGGAIGLDVDVYSDGTGKVGTAANVLTAAGTYWLVGKTVGNVAAAASGDMIEVETVRPTKVVVLAAFTSGTTANATDLATSEALANALKVDLASLRTALNTAPALVKVL